MAGWVNRGIDLGDGRALACCLLRFASSAFALLMCGVLVRGELPRSASRPLPGILLGFDRGALTGLVGRVLVGLKSSACARARRRGGQLRSGSVIGRGGRERTGQGRADHAARDQRSGHSRDGQDSLGWRQDASHLLLIKTGVREERASPSPAQSAAANLSEGLRGRFGAPSVRPPRLSLLVLVRGLCRLPAKHRLDFGANIRSRPVDEDGLGHRRAKFPLSFQ